MLQRKPGHARPAVSLVCLLAALCAGSRAGAERPAAFLELGPEYVDGYFALVEPGFLWEGDRAAVELAAPLRLRTNVPLASRRGVLRTEDWDGWDDLGRLFRRLEVSAAERAVWLRVGALGHQRLGHGTIVSDWSNSVSPDALPAGALGRLVAGPLALELVAANLLALDVLGASAVLEPLTLFSAPSDRMHVSFTAVADPGAPKSGGTGFAVYGAGVDVALFRNPIIRLAPYVDVNGAAGGFGLHAGLLADVMLGESELSVRAEWRRVAAPYQPEYFDLGYSLERLDALAEAASPLPKADLAHGAANTWRGEARFSAGGVGAAAGVSSRAPRFSDAFAVVEVELEKVELAAFAAARAFEWGGHADRVLVAGEARWRLNPYLYLWGTGGRLYRMEEGRAVPSAQLGAGLGGAVGL